MADRKYKVVPAREAGYTGSDEWIVRYYDPEVGRWFDHGDPLPEAEAKARRAHLEQPSKATPSQDYAESGAVHPCLLCGHDVKRVPGGQGPVWVHADTGTVVCGEKEG
jgi:hypothetical protein